MASPLLEVEQGMTPMSPSSQMVSSVLSLYIIGFAESQILIDHTKLIATLKTDLFRVNSRFSSLVIEGNTGAKWWKPFNVCVEDHVIIPTFPEGLSPEAYTKNFENYISKISLEHLPNDRPLWQLHIFKYPTRNAAGTLAFRMHHALGDGFSIMGAVFSCLKRADNPALPLTFPSWSKSQEKKNIREKITSFVSMCLNTTRDFAQGVMRSTMVEDSFTAIRSGKPYVEYMPINIATVTISLSDIYNVKSKIGVAASEYMHSTLRNTSFFISNLAGPVEQLVIADHPISSIYFAVTGNPQSLNFTVLSYMGKLKIVATMEKDFIDSELLTSCMSEAFKKIHEDACNKMN